MADMYKRFVPKDGSMRLSFSKRAADQMFRWESKGKGNLHHGIFAFQKGRFNGFSVGKHWMDITIGMWKADKFILPGITRRELKQEYPEWFLKKVGVL